MARKAAKAPDEQYILHLTTALKEQYGQDDTMVEEMRLTRTMEQPIDIPETLQRVSIEVRDPTATDEIARVVATVAHNQPEWHVAAANESDAAISASTKLEHWAAATLMEAGSRGPGMPTWRRAVDACFGDGAAWTKLLFTKDTWEEVYGLKFKDYLDGVGEDDIEGRAEAAARYNRDQELAKRRAGPPFLWQSVDVLSVYPVYDGQILTEMVEISERPTVQLLQQFGITALDLLPDEVKASHIGVALSEDEARKRLGTKLRFIQHWTETHCTEIVTSGAGGQGGGGLGGVIVKQFKHRYGRPPYFHALCLEMNQWAGRKAGWGVASSKRWLVNFKSWLLTLAPQDMVTQLGRPVGLTRPETAEPLIGTDGSPTAIKKMDWTIGDQFELDRGMEWIRFPLDSIAPALKDELAITTALIEQLDTPRVSSDIGGGLQGAGFAINQVLTEAKVRHDPGIQSLEKMLKDLTLFLFKLGVQLVAEKMYASYTTAPTGGNPPILEWVSVDPADLKRVVSVRVEINPELPSAKLVESRWLTELHDAGRISLDMAIEEEGRNPDEVRRSRVLEKLRDGPLYQAMILQEMLQEVGQGDLLQRLAQQAAESGTPLGMPPEMVQQLIQQQQLVQMYQQMQQGLPPPGGGPPPGPMGPGGPPQAGPMGPPPGGPMGAQDMGGLAAAPQGTGAAPIRRNGAVTGAGPGMVFPNQAARASGIQDIGR